MQRGSTTIQLDHGDRGTTNHGDCQQNAGHVNRASWEPSLLCRIGDTREGCEIHDARGLQRDVPRVFDGHG